MNCNEGESDGRGGRGHSIEEHSMEASVSCVGTPATLVWMEDQGALEEKRLRLDGGRGQVLGRGWVSCVMLRTCS